MKTLLFTLPLLCLLTSARPVGDPPYKYDLTIRLTKIVCDKVVEGPMDKEEDLTISAYGDMASAPNGRNVFSQDDYKLGTVTRTVTFDSKKVGGLTFAQLTDRTISLVAGMSDTEPGGIRFHYTMSEGNKTADGARVKSYTRAFKIKDWPSTFNHLKTLTPSGQNVPLKIGGDTFAETNFYENIGDRNSSHVTLYWQLLVTVKP